MKRNLAMIVVALSSIVALAGCAGKVGHANYYTLNLPAPPDPPVAENAHATVAIREFRAPGYLRQGAIVYKPSPEQIGFYAYHRWAVDPCDFVFLQTKPPIDSLYASSWRPTHIVLTAAMRKVRWRFLPQILTSSYT